jgi:hypothetical protein
MTAAAADAGITGRPRSGSINPNRPRSRDFCLRPSVTVKRCRSRRQALALDPGYSWKQSEKFNSRAVILTLTKDVLAFTLDSTSCSVQ